jgi:glucans biosynthesis protein
MSGDHADKTAPMMASPRCGARTRAGTSCRSPAVHGKKRCRMHGGAPGSGAPKGNRNAFKHGRYTKAAIAERRQVRALIRRSQKLMQKIW